MIDWLGPFIDLFGPLFKLIQFFIWLTDYWLIQTFVKNDIVIDAMK